MISLCVPSRERPQWARRMVDSALGSATGDVEVCFCVDNDDPTLGEYPAGEGIYYYHHNGGHHHSDLWNLAYRESSGNIIMLCADDLVFGTKGWDVAVGFEFAKVPDQILHVWCNDDTPDTYVATHPFVSRRWIQTVGFFTPPYFDAWFADTWLLDLALKIGRSVYLKDVHIAHLHWLYGTAEKDAVYRKAQAVQGSQAEQWAARESERTVQAAHLLEAMDQSERRLHEKVHQGILRQWGRNPHPIF